MRCTWRLILAGLVVAALAGCRDKPRPASAAPAQPAEAAGPIEAEPASPPARPELTAEQVLQQIRRQDEQPPAGALVDSPWASAAVGDYVVYGGQGRPRITQKVVRVTPTAVALEVSVEAGAEAARHELELPRRLAPEQSPTAVPSTARWSEQTARVGDRELRCRVATWYRNRAGRTEGLRLWLCEQVPGHIVRSERLDRDGAATPTQEVVDFGRAAG